MLVVLAHGEAIRSHRGIPSLEHLSIFHNGGLAVSFFFVLSGFLITTLLLREVDSFGTVSVRMFYQRRCMRILPLYFLLVILGVGVIPVALPIVGIDYQISYAPWTTTVWYLALLPFVVNVYYDVFVIGPLWSIGVEEWYYLLVAPVVKYFATTIRVVFAGVIVTKVIMLMLVDAHVIGGVHASFVTMLSFEHMAAGGITALAVRHFRSRNELQSPVQSKTWKLISWTLMTVLIVRLIAHERIAATFPAFRFIVDSYAATSIMDMGLFSLLLYVIVIQPPLCTTKIAKWTEHLGEYSYGIYMYHNVVAFTLTFGLAAQWRVLSVLMGTTLYHILLATITIAIAAVSRHTFEEYFLRKQKRPVSLP